MKKNYLLIFTFLLLTFGGYAQVVINEIMYNPPESGTDSLEYIELHNAGASAVDISGWQISRGISYTFAMGTSLPAGGFVVVTSKINALNLGFNYVTTHEWAALVGGASNGLSNSGETVELKNSGGVFVDSVKFGSTAPWPSAANGNGPSLELVSPSLDNALVGSWAAAVDSTNTAIINGRRAKGTPGRANNAPRVFTDVVVNGFTFTPKDITIYEGQTVKWSNTGGSHNVNGTQTAFPSNPASFSSGAVAAAPWNFQFTFLVPGSYNYKCDPHAPDMSGTIYVRPINPPAAPITYQIVTLDKLQSDNATGVADSLNKNFEVSAKVYGINIRTSGINFTIIDDNNNGVGVFNSTKNFGYNVTQGDEIKVRGRVTQFNGLTQLTADTLWKVSGGNSLVTPLTINTVNEDTESKLVKASGYRITNPAQWTNQGSNFSCHMNKGTDTIVLIIDSVSSIYGTSVPTGTINVTGIGTQFDPTSPFTTGYQLRPRFLSDLVITSTNDFLDRINVNVYPNPVTDLFTIDSKESIDRMTIYNQAGQLIAEDKLQRGKNLFNLVSQPSGYYLITLQKGNERGTIKIFKN